VPGSQSLGRARKNIISENHKCTRVQCQSKSYASKTAEGHSWLLQGGLTFDSASFEIDILTGCGPERVNSSTGSGNSRVDAKSWVKVEATPAFDHISLSWDVVGFVSRDPYR
jgi:hypothetical protein